MKSVVHVFLAASVEQLERLRALQSAFAEVCNALAPIVQQTKCWNRVGLHHLAYRQMRERFPQVGSQMVCNAIYSVSRTCRLVFQHPSSPFNVSRFADKQLPLLNFLVSAPVYFDRHTLSIKDGQLSMFTLDGRMKFQLDLGFEDLLQFREQKLREIMLVRVEAGYRLSFYFAGEDASGESEDLPEGGELPEYVVVMAGDGAAGSVPLSGVAASSRTLSL
jgi:hypothetical protein